MLPILGKKVVNLEITFRLFLWVVVWGNGRLNRPKWFVHRVLLLLQPLSCNFNSIIRYAPNSYIPNKTLCRIVVLESMF
jgi:hypothetical protein